MITVADLIAYRRRHDKLVERVVDDAAADRLRRVHRGRLPLAGRRQAPRRAGQGRRRRRATDVLVRVHSECLTGDVFHSLRCDCGEQLESALAMIEREGARRAALPRPGGPRDRPAEQAASAYNLQDQGLRHRRREPRARPAGRPARLRHRRADPRRPRAVVDPHPHQQPEEDPRPRGLRAVGHRAGADRARAQPAQRGLPARQARPAWATRSTTRGCRSTRRCPRRARARPASGAPQR